MIEKSENDESQIKGFQWGKGPQMIEKSENDESQIEGFQLGKGSNNYRKRRKR